MEDLNPLPPSPDAHLQQKTLIDELAQDAVLEEMEGNNAGEGAKKDIEEPASALKLDELLRPIRDARLRRPSCTLIILSKAIGCRHTKSKLVLTIIRRRQRAINHYQLLKSSGFNQERCEKAIEWVKKNMPICSPATSWIY